jgi:hypothetical protein
MCYQCPRTDTEDNQKHDKPIRAHCPTCDGERNCAVHGTVKKNWDYVDEFNGFSMEGGTHHSLMECNGCETVFYHASKWNSESWHPVTDEHLTETVTYPKPASKTKPEWLEILFNSDPTLHSILTQMYVALDNESNILAAIGLRTALDRATECLGIDPAETFENKLNELHRKGWIGESERDVLFVVTDAGNAAAHRGWNPDNSQALQLVRSLEAFLLRAFIVGNDALQIKEKLPEKPKRHRASKLKVIKSEE